MDSDSETYRGLVRVRDRGFTPLSILDVGAHFGSWARSVRSIFPAAYVMMIDALPEKEDALAATVRDLGNADYRIALLGSEDLRRTEFHVVNAGPNKDQSGSSKFKENTGFSMEVRWVPQCTLDSLVSDNVQQFQLLKLDVQGAELDVLRGASRLLENVEAILMEIAVVQYNAGAPLVAEVLAEMRRLGFVLHDILDEARAPGDDLLRQFDGLFLRADSPYRGRPPF